MLINLVGIARYCTVVTMLLLSPGLAWAIAWPQEISAPEGTVVVYQPQPESLDGNTLTGRAAISLELKANQDPVFGAMWFSARIDTDRDAGTALISDLKVTRVGWPDSKDAGQQRLTAVVEGAVPDTGFEISMEQLTASLATANVEQKSLQELKSEPPEIKFEQELAVLLNYDGEPHFSEVADSPYERALNTPFVVVRSKKSKQYYLGSGQFWYQARSALGPWEPTANPPQDLVAMMPADAITEADPAATGKPPKVLVATKPTELIATAGKPDWQSLPGGELLYVKNTETAWLRQLTTGNMYVLLSGRWYRAKSEQGPWTFVPADGLPESFADIPPASDIGGLRVSVAGTDEAEEALLDAAIPQTATINRSDASLTIEYDGKPRFEKIKGTKVAYAVNTGAQVLEIDGRYYAVDQGVWFTSAAATGPWVVADKVPDAEIAKIPPSSPVYNVTSVHIYESTPEVVYVGYTPGYMWSFPYYGVPVYGTGWHYPPYYGNYYYPRPPTWGFHVGYNPWTGWNYGVSWSNGFFSLGMSWGGGWGGNYRPWGCCGGWYGGGYQHNTIINTGDINIGNTVNIGNRNTIKNRIGDNNTSIGNTLGGRNIYQRPENRARVADRATARQSLKKARPAANRANNVYADKSGAVARRAGDDWETRGEGNWNTSDIAARAPEATQRATEKVGSMSQQQRDAAAQQARAKASQVQRPASTGQQRTQINRSDLNRAHQARTMGANREMRRPAVSRGGFHRR